jgi:uncharacterized protein DUF6984
MLWASVLVIVAVILDRHGLVSSKFSQIVYAIITLASMCAWGFWKFWMPCPKCGWNINLAKHSYMKLAIWTPSTCPNCGLDLEKRRITMRGLTDAERRVISLIAERLPSDTRRQQLLADMANAMAEDENVDGSRIVFHINGYQRPPYKGQHSFGVAGTLTDDDGAEIALDLYADHNDRLLDLELIRAGTGAIKRPDWNSLTLG